MKKSRLTIVLVLLVSVVAGTDNALSTADPHAYNPFSAHGEIPFSEVYNWYDSYTGYASDGEIYIAVGDGGHAVISRDLQSWKEIKRFTYENLIYVAYTGKKFVAFDDRLKYSSSPPKDNKMDIYVSENGIDWTKELVDIPQNVTRWYDLSFAEDEFVFVDADNSCYYMTKDFKGWNRIPFFPGTTNMHTHLSIKKLNGQYILLGITPDWPFTTKIYALSQDNEWIEKSSISGKMEQVRDLIFFKGNYHVFSYSEEMADGFKSIPALHVYTSKDMQSWTKSGIDIDTYPDSRIASLRALPVNGKIHLIYSIDNYFSDFSNRYKTVELISGDGTTWEKNSRDVPVRNDILDSEFSVLNDKEIFARGSGSYFFSKGDNGWKKLDMPSYSTGNKDVYYGNEFTVFQEVLYNYISPDIPATKTTTAITKDGKNMVPVEAPRISHWTGREFIAEGRATADFRNWRAVSVPEELSRFKDTIFYTWADGLYLAQVQVYYSGDRERLETEEILRQAGYDRTVYILDGNFNLIGEHKFDSIIRGFEFINGIYFVKLEDGRVFRSGNTRAWTESSLEELLEQPLYNGSAGYMRNDVTGNELTGISISADKQNWRSVVIDGKPLKNCSLAGDYYVAQEDDSIYLSKDGSYWIKITVPYKYGNSFRVLATSDCLLVDNYKWLFYYPLEAISDALDEPALRKEIQ